MSWLKSSPTTPRSVSRERSQPDPIFFGNNGEIISITVVAIRDGLVGGFEIADDAESKSITLYGKDATLYWGEDQECAGETGTEAYIFQIDEENGWLINFRSFKLSPDELVSVAEQVKIS